MIEYIFPYHILTDTDSTCVFFILVCKPESKISDEKYRDCLFEVIVANKILHRFDMSHKFWEGFIPGTSSFKKKARILRDRTYVTCYVTLAVNPKEYIECFKSENVNKKYKGLRKGAKGMDHENYSKRINSVRDIETFGQLSGENQK